MGELFSLELFVEVNSELSIAWLWLRLYSTKNGQIVIIRTLILNHCLIFNEVVISWNGRASTLSLGDYYWDYNDWQIHLSMDNDKGIG